MMSWLLSLLVLSQAATNPFFNDLENFRNQNLGLKTEQQNLEASGDLLLSKKLFWTPTVSLSASQSETRLNNVSTQKSDYLSANVSWNIFRGGADWHSLKEATAQNQAQELQVLNESLRVEIKASDLIFKSLYLAESQRIQEQLFKLKEEALKIANDRYQQGKLPLQEITKSKVDLVQQQNKLRAARLDVVENKSQITSAFISQITTSSWPFSEKTAFQEALPKKLPLVEQKYWQSQSREEAWKSQRGLFWPSLDFQLQYNESPIKERSSREMIGSLVLSWTLWDQYQVSAKKALAYSSYLGALNDYKDTEQTLKQKTLFLKEKIEVARLNLIDAKKNLEISRRLYQDILKSFRIGRISTNDLLIEQNRLLDSENALALSQLSFHQSLVESCALAGVKTANCLL